MLLKPLVQVGTVRPKYDIADVFRQYGAAYRREHPVTWQQHKVMRDIVQCRTAALGGYVEQCLDCGRLRVCYVPCDNRHCPKCGAFEKAQWLEARKATLLPIHYFHVVFTVDHAVNPLVRANQKAVYDLLFRAATETLKEYGQRYLGGEIGITAVLHTWGQDLGEHIHLHCIVTGGALSPKGIPAGQQTERGPRWQAAKKGWLFPIVALSRDYRDRFCAGLKRLVRRRSLKLVGACEGLEVGTLVTQMQAQKWEVYVKETYADPEQLLQYVGGYIYRIAISNYRLVGIGQGRVSFTYHDNRDGGQEKVMTLEASEFIRRFLLHVLPPRYVRVRHYGLHHASKKRALIQCRVLLGLQAQAPPPAPLLFIEWLKSLLEEDPRACPFCGGMMARRAEFGPVPSLWWLLLVLLGIQMRGRVVQ
jgi:hypothetical protein